MDIVLASLSKRRIEMMNELGFAYRVEPSTKDEHVDSFSSNEDLVMKLAKNKALDVFKDNQNSICLGFDTLVFLDNKILGKPHSKDECIKMIKSISNRTHEVITGGYIVAKDYEKAFYSSCIVSVMNIDDETIIKYAETEEPYDKAGGYAIQGFIGRFIDRVEGDFFSVIGMPKAIVYNLLTDYIKNH